LDDVRSATVTRFGGPEVLSVREHPDPRPQAGDLLVEVAVADVLFLETTVRSGAGREYWTVRPPYVPGNGIAGVVREVGPDVASEWIGRRLVAHTGNENGYADVAVVAAADAVPVPDGLDLATAAAGLHDLPTALRLFDQLGIGASDVVAVVGASGGLGVACVQLALARAGATVALARDPAKLDRIRRLGVCAVVDTDAPDWPARARAALPDGADVVLDNVGGDLGEAAFALVRTGGRFSGHGTPSGRFATIDPDAARQRGVRVTGIEAVQLSGDELRTYTERALVEAAAGTLCPLIGQVFPLERVADAHAAIERRTVFGKTLLITRPAA
jgi:NADPH2:quinone reductase